MSRLVVPVGPSDRLFGNPRAGVTLVEYGDYECPYCGRAQLVVRELLARHRYDVLFAFRHFPLTQLHPRALSAANAAEAAGAQGAFWQMHETLFANQHALEDEDLIAYADALGLDLDRFVSDLREGTYLPKIRADFRGGVRSGVNGTPTFFANGTRVDTGWSLESLEAVVRGGEALEAYR